MPVVMINDDDDGSDNSNYDDNKNKKEIESIMRNDTVVIPPGHRGLGTFLALF